MKGSQTKRMTDVRTSVLRFDGNLAVRNMTADANVMRITEVNQIQLRLELSIH